ncbi:MAG: hypothetical protein GYB36_11460 [Alphaproteobacteria bacterium]|nr:hypothetical protein [Alphaproteobacteria bacterium]
MRIIASFAVLGLALSGCSTLSTVGDALGSPEPNVGPCPTAFALYDAHRQVEFVTGEEAYGNVGFTAEILNVRSQCSYYGDNPILANLEIDMGFGRGPAARGDRHTYEYFVAITRVNVGVIDKQVFPIEVRFDRDEDRIFLTETIDAISIPRAAPDTSGINFEILVGYELTDEQLAYNRSGRRFRVIAGQE